MKKKYMLKAKINTYNTECATISSSRETLADFSTHVSIVLFNTSGLTPHIHLSNLCLTQYPTSFYDNTRGSTAFF